MDDGAIVVEPDVIVVEVLLLEIYRVVVFIPDVSVLVGN